MCLLSTEKQSTQPQPDKHPSGKCGWVCSLMPAVRQDSRPLMQHVHYDMAAIIISLFSYILVNENS